VYYNVGAGSFLSKKLCSRLHSIEVDFYSKKRKSLLFEPPFGRLGGNVHISSIARWKAHVRLPIRHNWTFFSLALTVETLQVEICRRERFLKGASLRSPIKGGRGRRPPTSVGWQKTRRIALSCGIKNIAGRFFGLITKHDCDRQTDRQTDGLTELRLPRPR